MTLYNLERKSDSLEQRLDALESKLCCGKPIFRDTFNDFPIEGKDNTLYVDESTGNVYIWDGTTYITADNTVQFVDTLPVTGTEGILYVLPDGTIHIWDGAAFITGGVTDHGALTGLSDDDHTQYLLLAGRTGGQTAIGGTAASNNLTLSSTSNATKGAIIFGDSRYNEATNRLVLGTSTGTGRINLPDAGTTASDGISFGTGNSIFRSALNTLSISGNILTGNLIQVGGQSSTVGRIEFFNSTVYLTRTAASGFEIGTNGSDGIILKPTAGSVNITPSSLTGSSATSALNITQTWNTTGSPTAINVDITNTASGAAANLMDLKVGGSSALRVTKNLLGDCVIMPTARIANLSVVSGNVINSVSGDIRLVPQNSIRTVVISTDFSSQSSASALLEVKSTVQGFLPPRHTTVQRDAIVSPVAGLTVYVTDATATDGSTGVMQTYNGTAWKNNW